MTIKNSLHVSIPNVKAFLTRNSRIGHWGECERNVQFCFRDPQKAHSSAKRHLTY